MATEPLAPDALIQIINLTGAVTDIQDDPQVPDANWLLHLNEDQGTVTAVTFPTPTGDLGGLTQTMEVLVRPTTAGTDPAPGPTAQVFATALDGQLTLGSSPPTVLTGGEQVITVLFATSELLDIDPDGSTVGCQVTGTEQALGAVLGDATVEVGAIRWLAEVADPCDPPDPNADPNAFLAFVANEVDELAIEVFGGPVFDGGGQTGVGGLHVVTDDEVAVDGTHTFHVEDSPVDPTLRRNFTVSPVAQVYRLDPTTGAQIAVLAPTAMDITNPGAPSVQWTPTEVGPHVLHVAGLIDGCNPIWVYFPVTVRQDGVVLCDGVFLRTSYLADGT